MNTIALLALFSALGFGTALGICFGLYLWPIRLRQTINVTLDRADTTDRFYAPPVTCEVCSKKGEPNDQQSCP